MAPPSFSVSQEEFFKPTFTKMGSDAKNVKKTGALFGPDESGTKNSSPFVSSFHEEAVMRSVSAPPPSSSFQSSLQRTRSFLSSSFQSLHRTRSVLSPDVCQDALLLAHCLAARNENPFLPSPVSKGQAHGFEQLFRSTAGSTQFVSVVSGTDPVPCITMIQSATGTGAVASSASLMPLTAQETADSIIGASDEGILIVIPTPTRTSPDFSPEGVVEGPGGGLPLPTKVIRPNPVKTAPPGAATRSCPVDSLEDPTKPPKGSGPGPTPSQVIHPSAQGKQQDNLNTEKAWCNEAADTAQQERDIIRQREKAKAAEQLRLRELQCNFPESEYSTMAPTNSGVRAGNTNEEYAHERHEKDNQVNNRASAVANHSNHRPGVRRQTEDEEQQSIPPTPLFERLVTEEVQELKAYARIIENQNRRLAELEQVHGDLESRLQVESKSRQQLEATLEAREREWAKQLEHLESDRDQWRNLVQAEETKNTRLMEEVMRKEQEIRRMLQRKVRQVARQASSVIYYSAETHTSFATFHTLSMTTKGGVQPVEYEERRFQRKPKSTLVTVALHLDLRNFIALSLFRAPTIYCRRAVLLNMLEYGMPKVSSATFLACEVLVDSCLVIQTSFDQHEAFHRIPAYTGSTMVITEVQDTRKPPPRTLRMSSVTSLPASNIIIVCFLSKLCVHTDRLDVNKI
jgi:hypothetical protein